MNTSVDLIKIFQSCLVYRELSEEFESTKNKILRLKEYTKYKKIRKKIINGISSLYYDTWTTEYIFNLQKAISILDLSDYKDYVNIHPIQLDESHAQIKPMSFMDRVSNTKYHVNITVQDTITVRVYENTGSIYGITTAIDSESAELYLDSCKHILVDTLIRYIDKK